MVLFVVIPWLIFVRVTKYYELTLLQSRRQDTRPGGACMILGGATGGGGGVFNIKQAVRF